MITKSYGATLHGIDPHLVSVEVDLQRGLPKFEMIGLAQTDVKEGKNRILSALQSVGVTLKAKRIIVNLAPATIQKEGGLLDLPIALALLSALEVIPAEKIQKIVSLGELSLDGKICSVRGALVISDFAKKEQFSTVLIPHSTYPEVQSLGGIEILPARSLSEVVAHLRDESLIQRPTLTQSYEPIIEENIDWSEVGGQAYAKRALEISAAGRHNVLLAGPPGIGKSLLAQRFSTLLPDVQEEEFLEIRRVYSVLGSQESLKHSYRPPYRSPHHHASLAGMLGGGKPFLPGDFTLAHRGVLFMDELPEFRRDVLEALREPLQDGKVSIARSTFRQKLPARFLFLGAMNLCPCGSLGDSKLNCVCTPYALERYQRKVSGPIKDRIDLWISLSRPTLQEVLGSGTGEKSKTVRERVSKAYRFQFSRNGEGIYNSMLPPEKMKKFVALDSESRKIIEWAVDRGGMTGRGIHKICAIARTLADLEQADKVRSSHISEALTFREFSTKEN